MQVSSALHFSEVFTSGLDTSGGIASDFDARYRKTTPVNAQLSLKNYH